MVYQRTTCFRALPFLAVGFVLAICHFAVFPSTTCGQEPPYDVFPEANPPYYRVRYDASDKPGTLPYAVNYTIWMPPEVKELRGVIVHQHGCGEGSCKSGLTGAFDLHWQSLARKHSCALLSPSYEQPEKADCQMWCDPRNGSSKTFLRCLDDLAQQSGHPELTIVPWALWGHSGGGHWAGGMALLYPDRVAAAWLRSGVPLLKDDTARPSIRVHSLVPSATKVPIMCNLGTKEGVTVKDDRFHGVWPANQAFFEQVRSQGGLIGVSVDPLTSHECGNQRYLAIPWLDACLSIRLPKRVGNPLQAVNLADAWYAELLSDQASSAESFTGAIEKASWLPNATIAKAWMEYTKDTHVLDTTPPDTPFQLRIQGNQLMWEAHADVESGLAGFLIERDGIMIARLEGKNRFGRGLFQDLQYSDTPPQPMEPMTFLDRDAKSNGNHIYQVYSINTVGLVSQPARIESK